MNEPQETKERVAVPEQGAVKKPYAKPQIIYRAPLEAMASVCPTQTGGKAVAGVSGCTLVAS
jgi:hypothetical protein